MARITVALACPKTIQRFLRTDTHSLTHSFTHSLEQLKTISDGFSTTLVIWSGTKLALLIYLCVCVCAYVKAEFDEAGARIVVVSFGSHSAAVQWQKETSCQYSILLDPERQVNQTQRTEYKLCA